MLSRRVKNPIIAIFGETSHAKGGSNISENLFGEGRMVVSSNKHLEKSNVIISKMYIYLKESYTDNHLSKIISWI